ncbi:apolipoprotein N-acyltransferase [Micromonospora sp. WMMD1155]|uniref:apolipoprotein N-acyltransferase n=1 Tax=Micromonospora sp. WMMD1155 TaxID=3016094 RepID=UPI00249C4F09|nr:apolipoprotein N-acyltransferase [Micromonospora sp. WMMD1155]
MRWYRLEAARSNGPRLSGPVALVAAVAAGFTLWIAFPPYGHWWAAPLGVALLAVSVRRQRVAAAAGLGVATGMTFFVPLLSFTGLQIGWWPWLLLASLQALFLAALGCAAAYTSGLVDRQPWAWPLVTGLLWTAQEALRSRIPFGGFPWGRLAFSQAEAPTLRWAALGGAPLVTFVVATAGGLVAMALWRLIVTSRWPAGRVAALVGAASVVLLLGEVVPTPAANGRSVVVAVVQGNVPRMGLDFNAQRRAVLDNHVDATLDLADDVRAGRRPRPNLVVWPENASDIDPLTNADAATRITEAARTIDAPILVGAVLQGPRPGTVRNAGLVWTAADGPTGIYVKRHPVPFAEYVPMRSLIRRVTPLVDRVRADFVAGSDPGPLDIGGVPVGDVICFEVAYDALVRDGVSRGAQLLAVQTNNATFNHAQASQQLAMVRLRAVEHARPALMASTVGISAFVEPDGTAIDATAMNTSAVLVREVRLASARTLATRLGPAPEAIMVGAALAVLAAAWYRRRAERTHRKPPGRAAS